jgi:glycerol uptake facilitator-like aquaporin
VLGKIAQAFSEVVMSALLVILATGWTLTYQELELDDGSELYLPVGALVIMVHVIMSALTFVDLDASHKYHDFAGI